MAVVEKGEKMTKEDLIEIRRWCMIFGAIQLVSGVLLMLAYAL